jgi:hypothetical protein
VFGIYCSLPTNRSNVNAFKSVNTTRFAEGPSPKGFCPIDEQSKAFEVIYDNLGSFRRNNNVITKHKYSPRLMKPKAL